MRRNMRESGYRAMAADTERERDAVEWVNGFANQREPDSVRRPTSPISPVAPALPLPPPRGTRPAGRQA